MQGWGVGGAHSSTVFFALFWPQSLAMTESSMSESSAPAACASTLARAVAHAAGRGPWDMTLCNGRPGTAVAVVCRPLAPSADGGGTSVCACVCAHARV